MSYKSVPQECPIRVSYKSVIWTYVYSFSNVFASGFVGSILLGSGFGTIIFDASGAVGDWLFGRGSFGTKQEST